VKVVAAWLCLVALALVVANCSIKHASEQFECETNADCAGLGDNRVCSEGLCVVPGGNMKDAAVGDAQRGDASIDASQACPEQCTSCKLDKKECVIDCNQNQMGCANQQVKCPAGFDCTVKCNTPSSCRNGIDCLTAGSCTVECTGSFSCRNVACGPGPCLVTCAGNNSCSGISCGQSCACDVKCAQNANCFNVICGKPLCDTGLGCSSEPVTCDTCLP
jgi:hypothetical protein